MWNLTLMVFPAGPLLILWLDVLIFEIVSINIVINVIQYDFSLFKGVVCCACIFLLFSTKYSFLFPLFWWGKNRFSKRRCLKGIMSKDVYFQILWFRNAFCSNLNIIKLEKCSQPWLDIQLWEKIKQNFWIEIKF